MPVLQHLLVSFKDFSKGGSINTREHIQQFLSLQLGGQCRLTILVIHLKHLQYFTYWLTNHETSTCTLDCFCSKKTPNYRFSRCDTFQLKMGLCEKLFFKLVAKVVSFSCRPIINNESITNTSFDTISWSVWILIFLTFGAQKSSGLWSPPIFLLE